MAKKQRGYAAPDYSIQEELTKLSQKRPRRNENKLVIVPSLSFMGRRQPEDVNEDAVSYRNPHEFLEFAFPENVPADIYPFISDPVFGFTCGAQADVRYIELESMFKSAVEIFYDELGFDEQDTRSATRTAFLDLHRKLGDGKPMLARLFGDDDFAEVTPRYMRSTMGLSQRLYWSYAANFRGLVFPLLGVAPGEPLDLRHVARNLAGGRSRLMNSLAQRDTDGITALKVATSRPGYLAMLYAMRDASQSERDAVYEAMMDPGSCDRISLGQRLVDGVWRGAGDGRRKCADAADDIVALIATGMLAADGEESILNLTSNAETLLEVLPEACDQSDWGQSLFDSEGFIPMSQGSAVDDWIRGFFDKLASSSVLAGLRKGM